MIPAVICALLVVIFGGRVIYRDVSDFIDGMMLTLFLAFLSAIGFGVGAGLSSLVGLALPKQWVQSETATLVSLRNSESASGSFFLGMGSIGSSQYFSFYKESGKGYQPGQILVGDNTLVFEGGNYRVAELKVFTHEFEESWLRWIALDWTGDKYEFYIPEGSLKKNYVLQ